MEVSDQPSVPCFACGKDLHVPIEAGGWFCPIFAANTNYLFLSGFEGQIVQPVTFGLRHSGDLNTYFALQTVNKVFGKFPLSAEFFHDKDDTVRLFDVSHGPFTDSVEIRCEELLPKDFRHFHISTIVIHNKL
jgi:hypothetical protein